MSTFIVSAATYARLVKVMNLEVDVNYKREYEVEFDEIDTEEELIKTLNKLKPSP